MGKKTLLSWSSGKDSAWALHQLKADPSVELVGLLCTVNQAFDRVAMHGVRVELLRQQAASAGLPLRLVEIPYPCNNEQYAQAMGAVVGAAVQDGVQSIAFGDLFLEDIRRYREDSLRGSGLSPAFPLWQLPTPALAREMVGSGLKAVVTCLDPRRLPASFAGREFNDAFLDELPPTVDPCGEHGEFHTFAFAGPVFEAEIALEKGVTVERDGFVFTDFLPPAAASAADV